MGRDRMMLARMCLLSLLSLLVITTHSSGLSEDGIVPEVLTEAVSFEGHSLVKIKVETEAQKRAFDRFVKGSSEELDLWQDAPGSHAVMRLSPKHHELMQRTPELVHEVLHQDVQQLIDVSSTPSGSDFFDNYQHVDLLLKHIKGLAARHSGVVSVSQLGKSFEGRPILAIHIAKEGLAPDAPEVFIQSGQHAREWIGPAATVFIAEAIANAHHKKPQSQSNQDAESIDSLLQDAQGVLQSVRITLVPLVNPDGYHHTYTSNRMWRKNRHRFSG